MRERIELMELQKLAKKEIRKDTAKFDNERMIEIFKDY